MSTSSFLTLFFVALSINLAGCSSEQYQLHTQLKRNGVLLGPTSVEIKPASPRVFLLPLSEANELRYLLEENNDGSVYLQAELIKLTSDSEVISPLSSFILFPDGKEAELEFQLDENQPHYQWTASITPL